MPHRNSQKRKYIPGRVYFITTNTFNSFPYFENDILCQLFEKELEFCRKLFGFEIYAYKINPDHIHLLICPGNNHNYSAIMQFVKRHFTRNCNIVMDVDESPGKGDNGHCRLYKQMALSEKYNNLLPMIKRFDIEVLKMRDRFFTEFGPAIDIPRFKWQKSFHYHCIANGKDLMNHIQYIQKQSSKHKLNKNRHCFVDKLILKLILSISE
jgi:REP element-mobilizing transposase RayT